MARIRHRPDTIYVLKNDPRVWVTPDEVYAGLKKIYRERTAAELPVVIKRSLLWHLAYEWVFALPPSRTRMLCVLGDLVVEKLVAVRPRTPATEDGPGIDEYSLTTLGRCNDHLRKAKLGKRGWGILHPAAA